LDYFSPRFCAALQFYTRTKEFAQLRQGKIYHGFWLSVIRHLQPVGDNRQIAAAGQLFSQGIYPYPLYLSTVSLHPCEPHPHQLQLLAGQTIGIPVGIGIYPEPTHPVVESLSLEWRNK